MKAVSRSGWTAIHFAARNTVDVDVVDFVLDQGFDIECSDYNGHPPLYSAIAWQNSKGCERLLKRGALNNKKFSNIMTPVRFSITTRHPESNRNRDPIRDEILEIFLKFGADILDNIKGTSVLEIVAKDREFTIVTNRTGNILMRHMAILQVRNITISEDDRRTISEYDCYKEYYRMCLQECEKMMAKKFYNNVTVFNFAMGNEKVISRYARNDDLMEALKYKNAYREFPIYAGFLWKKYHRFCIEVEKQSLRKSVAKVLSNLFELNEPTHPVNQKILDYLQNEDLHILAV